MRQVSVSVSVRLLGKLLACVAIALVAAACGDGSVRSPFPVDAGSEAGAAGSNDGDGGLNVGVDAGDPTLGGPCADDEQCDDGFPCTSDRCDPELQRCRHTPDDTTCADDVYCNGEEVCDPKLGCQAGAPVACADSDPCTIDTCVEATRSCTRAPRDADEDGDPIWNCTGGGDCNDNDPSVSSKADEVCGNGKDDDCDGEVDEAECVTPAHDTCVDALVIAASGFHSLSLSATALDYPTKCAPAGEGWGDVVVALQVPAGEPQDIDVVAQSDAAQVSLSSAPQCGNPEGLACSRTFASGGVALSRLRLHGLSEGTYPLYVAGAVGADVALSVTYSNESAAPANETCGTALPLVPGQSTTVSLASAVKDVSSICEAEAGELVYTFALAEARDVRIYASSLDSYGQPQLSLRGAACAAPKDELTCRAGAATTLFARALPAGTYFLSVGASGPSDIDVRLEESPATAPPADAGCSNPPALASGQTLDIPFSDATDSVSLGCLAGAPDSSQRLTLSQTSDVLLVERISDGDTGAVSLSRPSCDAASRLSCGTGSSSPVRSAAYGVAAGEYRVVAESASGNPVSLTAYTRKAVPQTLVALADDCSAPFEIPATGGRFKGNTANAHADFSAGCDVGNQSKFGALDQILHLKLEAKSRVVFDMGGSSYSTLLSVRRGTTCPGAELPFACAAGYLASRSFLDLELDSGDYYVQIDGYAGAVGAWALDVYVTPDAI